MTDSKDPKKKPPDEQTGDGDLDEVQPVEAATPADEPTTGDGQATVRLTPEEIAQIAEESYPSDPDDPLVGTLLRNKWRVLSRIGAGSFGTVYKVRDENGGWIEALKILSVDRLRGPDGENMRKRFLREARIMKRLGSLSPHIVGLATYEDDVEAGLIYFLMEHVEGRVLSEVLLQEGPLGVDRTIRIGLQACDALIAAHEGDDPVVHRDLKLENLMLTEDRDGEEVVKVLDFGIAKIVERDADSRLTGTGTLGTPGYAAPEQLRAGKVDGRTDLFAFGVILYSLVTGRNPWLGHLAYQPSDQTYELMAASDRAEVRPFSESGVDVPQGMIDIILKLLQRDPDDRFQSARELREALYDLGGGEISGGRLSLTRALKGPKQAESPGTPTTPERRLAAVWFADLVGYSTLSSQDEEAALALLDVFHKTARRVIEGGGGRVVQFIGDAAFAEFSSTQRAVRTAKDFVDAFGEDTAELAFTPQLRVGIHVGDVLIAADGDLFGDGVNVAARIQNEAEPGQILVSQDVWRQLKQRRDFGFVALGERSLKGIGAPVGLFAVVEAGDVVTTGDLVGVRTEPTTGLPVYPGATGVGAPGRSRARVGAAAVIALLAVGGGAYVAVRMGGDSPDPRSVTNELEETPGNSGALVPDSGVVVAGGGVGTPAGGSETEDDSQGGGEEPEAAGDQTNSGANAGGGDEDAVDSPPPASVASVRIAGLPAQLTPRMEVTLSATALDAQGVSLSGLSTTWSSSDSTIARVADDGTLTAVAPGSADVTVSMGSVSQRGTLTVLAEPVVSLSVTPSSLSLTVGDGDRLTAQPLSVAGSPLAGRSVRWTSDDPDVASVTQAGQITAAGPGRATITAVSEGASASTIVVVTVTTRTAIEELIANYARALETRDIEEVRGAYPDISTDQEQQLGRALDFMDELEAVLTVRDVDATGNTATATVTGTYSFRDAANRRDVQQHIEFLAIFRRGPNGWRLVETRD